MSKRHIINLSDVINYEFEHLMAASSGVGINRKRLYVVVAGRRVSYRVEGGERPLHTDMLMEAVEAYNDI